MKNELIEILYDTRETKPLWLEKHQKELNFHLQRQYLHEGDFGITGFESEWMQERKTITDLVNSFIGKKETPEGIIINRRQQFENMWKRVLEVGYKDKTLLIIGDINDLNEEVYVSQMKQESVWASLCSWKQKYHYDIVNFLTEAQGQRFIYWSAKEFIRNRKLKRI